MKESPKKRIVPAAILAALLCTATGGIQAFFIFGGLEVSAASVERIAPFAHEAFLKAMGEHPAQRPATSEPAADKKSSSAMANAAGFDPEELSVTIDGVGQAPVIEPVVPVKKPVESKPAPKLEEVDDDVPVG